MAARTTRKKGSGDEQLEYIGNLVVKAFQNVFKGIKRLREPGKLILFLIVTLAAASGFYMRAEICDILIPGKQIHIVRLLVTLLPMLPILLLYFYGAGEEAGNIDFEKKFEEIRFCGKGGVYPKFLSAEKGDNEKEIIYSFHTPGLNLAEWRNRQTELETVLDCNIVKFETAATTKQVIKLHTIPTEHALSTNLPWNESCVKKEDFLLCAGEGILEEVNFDLNKYPHALIAGVTGSGKSVILRCLLWQCIRKGARIFMVDFKGGVEFGQEYETFGEVITDRDGALELLKELTNEMKLRLNLFRQCGVKNLAEYNQKHEQTPLCRIVLVCDEVAEMLDKTGLSSQDKAIYYEIEKEMSTVARLGRSPGINMLLATQRPDAKVIVGQIKNNLPIRISGRMIDPQASEMVLGNTKASLLGDTLGRFMYTIGSDTHEFQAFHFKDSQLISGDYQMGSMLSELSEGDMAEGEMEGILDDAPSDKEDTDDWTLEEDDEDDEYEGF